MKNAAKLAPLLKALPKKLAKKHPPSKFYDDEVAETKDPLKSLLLGALRYELPEKAARAALKRLDDTFVDANDLRVATELEVADVLAEEMDEPTAHRKAILIRMLLSSIFDTVGRLSLDTVGGQSRREIRPALKKALGVDEMDDAYYVEAAYAESHIALFAFDFGVLPIDTPTHEQLVANKVIAAEADVADASKFCELNLKVEDCRSLFASLRQMQK